VPFPSGTTTPNETGTIMRVEDASVLSSREVKISGLDNEQAAGWGTAIGAAVAGTSAYGITKADNPAGVAITVVAAIVGGLAGLAAEEFRETRQGAEYISATTAASPSRSCSRWARARRSTRPEPTCR
jgi:outer membrane lipoprotein SlyB